MHTARFSLRLLGGFEVLRDGKPLSGRCGGKMRALLGYLAAESAQPHTRRSLGAMLWPEQDEDHARQSLRQALTGLRAVLGDREGPASLLRIGRESIALNPDGPHEIDVTRLAALSPTGCTPGVFRSRADCRQCHQVAAAHYRGEFLAGLSVPDAPEFQSWLECKRQWFGRQAAEVFADLAACYEQSGQGERALEYARAQLRSDPWNEQAHRQVMRLLAAGGRRKDAIAHYRHVCTTLAEELGIEPEEETRALYERARRGLIEPVAALPIEPLAGPGSGEPCVCPAAAAGHAGERRVLTVLSCDAGCALGEDPEDLHRRSNERLAQAANSVRQHGGHVVESDGIGLTAYFGYPLPCEEPSLQAIRAAVALRESASGRQRLRTRVHTDVVFVPPRRRAACDPDASIVGTAPRYARALHRVAPEIDVAISASTYGMVRGAVECRSIPSQVLPDAAQPIALHEVVRILEATEQARPASSEESPLRIAERVGARLDRLGRAKALVQLASNIGREFSEARLGQLLSQVQNLGLDAPTLAEELDRLVRLGIFQSWTEASVTCYRFRQPTVQEVAYRSQSRSQQRLYEKLLAGLGSVGPRRPPRK
jgi:DNA-binding SARP family transcriptional activator/class 3 adenylate cyclase